MKTNLSHPCFRSKKKEPFLLNTKFVAVFFVASLLVPLLALIVFSHPGKTDSSGGHYNRSTGEYHYHHGYPAHSHENGICPYDFDDKTASKEATTRNNATTKKSDKYTTEAQYALMTAKDKKQSDSKYFPSLNAPEFLIFASLIVVSVTALVLSIVLWQRSKKIKDLNGRISYYNFENNRLKSENSNQQEKLRLKETEYEKALSDNLVIQYKCNLYKMRTNYLFITKHLKNTEYERYYLDSLEDLKQYTVSPFDTMNYVAPMVSDYLLISIKQEEENLNRSTRYSDKTRAEKIADIRKETKELLTKYIQSQYKLEYLLQTFPNLDYLIFVDAPYRNSEVYMQAKKNIAETLPTLKEPTQARWHTFFNICVHYLFEFGSPPVYEMIFQKLVLEITQMEKENSNSIWDLNMQVSSLSLLFAISDGLLKTAKCFCDTEDNEVTASLRNFSKYCLTKQLEQDGISKDVFDSLIKETEH